MNLKKKLLSEFIGTLGLLMIVVGSGIMGESLSQGNLAIALLANSLATGAGLFVLIEIFGPISDAHFNPAVSMIEFSQKNITKKEFTAYIMVQIIGAVIGVWLTHFIFGQNILQTSSHDRGEFPLFASEALATCGLILVILLSAKKNSNRTSLIVAAYITAAYWFTSSTSFANPAVTLARSLTNTFSGIKSSGVLGFILAQIIGAIIGLGVFQLFKNDNTKPSEAKSK